MTERISTPKAKLTIFLLAACTAFLLWVPAAAAQTEGANSEASPAVDAAETFHALGLMISQQLAPLAIQDGELEQVIKGIRDGLGGEVDVDPREIMPKVQALATERAKAAGEIERKAAAEFLAKKTEAAKAKGGEVTETGLIYTELTAGTGASPTATDRVKVHYHGTLRDGSVFDSSRDRGEPVTFGLNQVIKCWTEGVAKMKVGGKAQLVCPSDIAYGDRPAGKIPPGAALVFEVELLEIVAQPAG